MPNTTVYVHLTETSLPDAGPFPVSTINDYPTVAVRVGDASLLLDQHGAILLSDAVEQALHILREAEAAKDAS